MAYDIDNIKNEVNSILPPNSRLPVTAHHSANSAIIDYLFIPFGIALPFFGDDTAIETYCPNCCLADGRSLNRSDYPYLFAIYGTKYGSDDELTFKIPNISAGSSLIQAGINALTNTNFTLGSVGGEEKHQLNSDEIPSHKHYMFGGSINGGDPNTLLGTNSTPAVKTYYGSGDSNNYSIQDASGEASIGFTSHAGENMPHNNMSPYIACNWIIRLK